MQGIVPHLWFDTDARQAAEFYAGVFPSSEVTSVVTIPGTPAGDTTHVSFALFGQPFQAISPGPPSRFTPAVSFSVSCASADEVDRYWNALRVDGSVLMELGSYPFSPRYGWTTDRYGLSWQIMLADDDALRQRITPSLLFTREVCGRAHQAIDTYTSVFPNSDVEVVVAYGPDAEADTAGDVMYASFRLAGQRFAAMDSAHDHRFGFNEAVSLLVRCEDQQELDRYTDALSAVPEAEQCGWVKDAFGVSWQLAPVELDTMMADGSPEQVARVTQAFLPMRRIDLAELHRAFAGQDASGG